MCDTVYTQSDPTQLYSHPKSSRGNDSNMQRLRNVNKNTLLSAGAEIQLLIDTLDGSHTLQIYDHKTHTSRQNVSQWSTSKVVFWIKYVVFSLRGNKINRARRRRLRIFTSQISGGKGNLQKVRCRKESLTSEVSCVSFFPLGFGYEPSRLMGLQTPFSLNFDVY